MLAAKLMRAVPIQLCVVGRKRDYVLRALDLVWRARGEGQLRTEFGTFMLSLDHAPERVLGHCLYNLLRYYDRSELGRYIRSTAHPGKTFLDIGANLGIYALLARRAGMKTVVVEPDPAHASFLAKNASIYGTVLPVALSNTTAELPLYYDETNPAGTSLCNALDYEKGAGTVPVRTFSEFARRGDFGKLEDICLIKVDVEGVEVELIEGMMATLEDRSFRPDIWCEVRGDAAGRAAGSCRTVRALLERYGYVTRDPLDGFAGTPDDRELSQRIVFDLLFTTTPSSIGSKQ